MDLSHKERSRNAAEAYAPQDSRAQAVRNQSARMIENVIKAHAGKREIEILLAIGSVCPFTNKYDRLIWIEEMNRLMGTRSGSAEAA